MATRDLPQLLAAARALPPGERLRLAAEIAPEGTQFPREGILRLLDGEEAAPGVPLGPQPTDRLSLEEVAALHQRLTARERPVSRAAVLKWGRGGVKGVRLTIRGAGSAKYVLRRDYDAWMARIGHEDQGDAPTAAPPTGPAAELPVTGSIEEQIAAAKGAYSRGSGSSGRRAG